ncbi:MAG: L-lactate permease [Clostridia bacterium]|nr:L-lactate permease [Clostridia bacterium]
MTALIALLPLVVIILLLVAFNWPAKRVMPIAWAFCLLLAVFVWKMTWRNALAYSLYGAFKGFETLVTIMGAVLLLNTLSCSGAMRVISRALTTVSNDRRIQAVIIGWMFNSFIEGAAGFGTPAALAAPLLVGVGFPPLAAAMFALICNTTAVAFGVVGVPTLTGLSQVQGQVIAAGFSEAAFNTATIRVIAILHGCSGLFVPLIALCMLTKFFGKERSIRPALAATPFALFAGAAFVVPSVILAFLFGAEFPSLVGALIGLVLTVTAAMKGFLVPKTKWDFPEASEWAPDWKAVSAPPEEENSSKISPVMAWLPYGLITLILVASRIPAFGLTDTMKNVTLTFNHLLGVEGLNYSLQYLWLPGTVFIIVSFVTVFLHRMKWSAVKKTVVSTGKQVYGAVIAMLFGVALVQLMLNSGVNDAGLTSMMNMIASGTANLFKGCYLAVAPLIGVLGSFVSGSNTVSNMLFASMQFETALLLKLSPVLIVALQCVGGGIGNMICINNIVAACSTVGVRNMEGKLVRRNLIPCLLYCTAVILLAVLFTALGLSLLNI